MPDFVSFTEEERALNWVLTGEWPLEASSDLAFEMNLRLNDLADQIYGVRDWLYDLAYQAQDALPTTVAERSGRVIESLADMLTELGDTLTTEHAANQTKHASNIGVAKVESMFELALLIAQLAIITAMSFFTGGLSLSEAAVAKARTTVALLTIAQRLFGSTPLAPLTEALEEGLTSIAAQLTYMGITDGGRRPSGIDWSDVGRAALVGALAGLFAGGLSDVIGKAFKSVFKNVGENKWRDFGGDLFRAFTSEGLGEGSAVVLTNGLLDGNWQVKWNDFVGAGVSAVSEEVLGKGGEGFGKGLNKGFLGGGGGFNVFNSLLNPDSPRTDHGNSSEITGTSDSSEGTGTPVPPPPVDVSPEGLPLSTLPPVTGSTGPTPFTLPTSTPPTTTPFSTPPLETPLSSTPPLTSTLPPLAGPPTTVGFSIPDTPDAPSTLNTPPPAPTPAPAPAPTPPTTPITAVPPPVSGTPSHVPETDPNIGTDTPDSDWDTTDGSSTVDSDVDGHPDVTDITDITDITDWYPNEETGQHTHIDSAGTPNVSPQTGSPSQLPKPSPLPDLKTTPLPDLDVAGPHNRTTVSPGPEPATAPSEAAPHTTPEADATPPPPADQAAPPVAHHPPTAEPVRDPVRPDQWRPQRQHTPAISLHAQLPAAPNPVQHTLDGTPTPQPHQDTVVRTDVRSIPTDDGRAVRDLSLELPVRFGEGFSADQLPGLQERIHGLLDSQVNHGLSLPGSNDQLHIGLNLVHDPGHPESIELTAIGSANPVPSDQFHIRLTPDDPALGAPERNRRQARNDATALRQILRYAGIDVDPEAVNHPLLSPEHLRTIEGLTGPAQDAEPVATPPTVVTTTSTDPTSSTPDPQAIDRTTPPEQHTPTAGDPEQPSPPPPADVPASSPPPPGSVPALSPATLSSDTPSAAPQPSAASPGAGPSDTAKLEVGRRFSALMRDLGHPVVLAGPARGQIQFRNPRALDRMDFHLPTAAGRYADTINAAIAQEFPGAPDGALRAGPDGRVLTGVVHGVEITVGTAVAPYVTTTDIQGFTVPGRTESLADTAYSLALGIDAERRVADLFDLVWGLLETPFTNELPVDELEMLRGEAYRQGVSSGDLPWLSARIHQIVSELMRDPRLLEAHQDEWEDAFDLEDYEVAWLDHALTKLNDSLNAAQPFVADPLRQLAWRLPAMSPAERARELSQVSSADRERLASNRALVDVLRDKLPSAEFAETAAQLMVQLPVGVDQPVSVRSEVLTRVARMLSDPEVAAKLLKGGSRVVVVPKDEAMTSLDAFRKMKGAVTSLDGRSWDKVRGSGGRTTAVTEENLIGEVTSVASDTPAYPDGYSTTTHEFAHTIHRYGLSDEDQQLIEAAYRANLAEGPRGAWPDGPLYGFDADGNRTRANYSSHDVKEFFAQLTNTYLGTNRGRDAYTKQPRNNGADWVRRNEPELLPLLERLYGGDPRAEHTGQANPVEATRAENETYEGFRALWDRAERVHVPQPHTLAPSMTPIAPTDTAGLLSSLPEPQPGARGPSTTGNSLGQMLHQAWTGSPSHGDPASPAPLPAPPPPGQWPGSVRVRLEAVLRDAFGPEVGSHETFEPMLQSLAVLESARVGDPRFGSGPMDLEGIARWVLHLDPSVSLTPELYFNALSVVGSAARRGRAGSLAKVAACGLAFAGAVAGPTELRSSAGDRFMGRNWTGGTGLDLLVDRLAVVGASELPSAPWGAEPYVVLAERAESDRIEVRDGHGNPVEVDEEEFAELVAHDPERPAGAHVLLLVPGSGQGMGPRLVADRAGVRVWATDGEFRLVPKPDGSGRHMLFLAKSRSPGSVPQGTWIPSDPGLVADDPSAEVTANDGAVFPDTDVQSFTLLTADGRELTGRAFLNETDMAIREDDLRPLSAVEFYSDLYEGLPGVDRNRESPLRPLPRPLRDAYLIVGHGQHGRAVLPRRSTGLNQTVRPKEIGRMLARRKSLRRMRREAPVWALWCELGGLAPGKDPLEAVSGAQDVANETGRTVFSTDAEQGSSKAEGQWPPRLIKFDDPDRPAFRWLEFRPEPRAEALTALADMAGLPPRLERRTTRVLRWVRALRRTHGVDIDTNPERAAQFQELIQGFASLERLRLTAAGNPDTGPLTWRVLESLVGAFAQQQGWDPTVNENSLGQVLHAALTGGLSHDDVTVGEPVPPPPPGAAPDHAPGGRRHNGVRLPDAPSTDDHDQDQEEPAGAPPLSEFIRTYGARHDGHIGLVRNEPTPESVLKGLHRQIIESLGVDVDSEDGRSLRTQLHDVLSATDIELNRPYLRSSQGHRITVRHAGRARSVDVRLTYAHGERSAKYGPDAVGLPEVQIEHRPGASQLSSASDGSSNMRSVAVPWTLIKLRSDPGPVRWGDVTVVVSATHNQLSRSHTVGETLTVTGWQHSQDPAHPVDFEGRWQIRVDTPREDHGNWLPERSHGPVTVWVPEHLVLDSRTDPADLPEPADVDDDVPLWGVESVGEPRRLLTELLAHEDFNPLARLGTGSAQELEEFLSEQMLRGAAQLQTSGGVFSPTLTDARGNAIGMLELAAVIEQDHPTSKTPDGEFSLGTWPSRGVDLGQSAEYTSGIEVTGSGGPAFTVDHREGHPDATAGFAGNLFGEAGVNWQTTDGLSGSSSAALMQGFYTNSSSLRTPGRVTYRVTLHLAGGGKSSDSFGPWDDALRLLAARRETVRGHRPGPHELRELPDRLETLTAVGHGETPLRIEGTDPLFDEATEWLREEGFLPPAEHRAQSLPIRFDERLRTAQLANLRKLGTLRTRFGLATSLPDAVDGKRSLWLEKPSTINGSVRRLRLVLSVARDMDQPSEHTRVLPDVNTMGYSSAGAGGSRQHSTSWGGGVGAGGGFTTPAPNDTTVNVGPGFGGSGQKSSSETAGTAIGLDELIIASGGSGLWTVPARYSLAVYEGVPRPDDRTDDRPDDGTEVGSGTATVPWNPARAPLTARGTVTLLVPLYRTRKPDPNRAPVTSAPWHVIRPVAEDDFRKLGLVDEDGRPLPGVTRLPEGATVDTFRAREALVDALEQVYTGTYPGAPGPGAFTRTARGAAGLIVSGTQRTAVAAKSVVPESFAGALNRAGAFARGAGGPVARAAHLPYIWMATAYTWGSTVVAGASPNDPKTLAPEVQDAGFSPAQLVSWAGDMFRGGRRVVEGLPLSGMLADQIVKIDLRGYLVNPELVVDDPVSVYTDRFVSPADTLSRQRQVGRTGQAGFHLTALQWQPNELGYQANPSGQRVYRRRTDSSGTNAVGTKITHVSYHDGDHFVVTADGVLVVEVHRGSGNLFLNSLGLGGHKPVTLAIDLPGAVTYLVPVESLARNAQWYRNTAGLPPLTLPEPSVPLPDRFARTRELGVGSVLSVHQFADPARLREQPGRLHEELTALVEREAPGATRPGHRSYLPGVASEVARLTNPTTLHALPGRGSGGFTFHFLHVADGGARLVEVTVRAEPTMHSEALRRMRGRPTTGGGLEVLQERTNTRSTALSRKRTHQTAVNPNSRYTRPSAPGTDQQGMRLMWTDEQAVTGKSSHTVGDVSRIKAGSAADFDNVDYDLVASVTSAQSTDWPMNVPGGLIQAGLLNLSGLEGNPAERLSGWIRRVLHGRPQSSATVPATMELRFSGSESVEPQPYDPPRPPALLTQDPLAMSSQEAVEQGTPPFPGGPRLVPTGMTVVYDFNAIPQLEQALHSVAPGLASLWGLSADASTEVVAARLGELIRAGDISVGESSAEVDPTPRMPGSWPEETGGSVPTLDIRLYNPRPVTQGDDHAMHHLRTAANSASSSSEAGTSFSVEERDIHSLEPENLNRLGLNLPLGVLQSHPSAPGGSVAAARYDRMRWGSSDTSETLVDVVLPVTGAKGTVYVTGTATMRLGMRDLLGFGATAARPKSGVYDIPAMLAGQDADDMRDWARHPVMDLPEALVDGIDSEDDSAQLWLALGSDPDGTRLARALFVASRTAARTGKPVELVVRTDEGPLRHWPFTADGEPADTTDTTGEAWRIFGETAQTYTTALAAEAQAVATEQDLRADHAVAEYALRESSDVVAAAIVDHQVAETAYQEAVRQAELARESANTAVAAAQTELARVEGAIRDAEAAPPTEEQVRLARLAWRQAHAEVQSIERMAAAGGTQPDLAAAEARATAAQARWTELQQHSASRETALSTARAALLPARNAAGMAHEEQTRVELETGRSVAEARRGERDAAGVLTQRTRFRDRDLTRLRDVEQSLQSVLVERQNQTDAHRGAWRGLTELAATLDTLLRAEGTGQAGSVQAPQVSAPVGTPGDTDARPATETDGPVSGPPAPRGPLPVLSRARLERLVDRVAARGPAVDVPVERCVELLGDLRGEWYPRGVGAAVALDAEEGGRSSAASSLAAGPGWRGVRSWDAVAEAVEQAGPGASALVLARRQGGALGHAWAAYHLDGMGVVWVDASKPAGSRVSDVAPDEAPSDARAVVIGPSGQVVADALPEFAQSSSTAHAVLDAATEYRFGAPGGTGSGEGQSTSVPWSPETSMAGPSGAPRGRNLTGEKVRRLRVGQVRVFEERPGVPLKEVPGSEEKSPWGDTAYVVWAGRDDERVLHAERLATGLAEDPELARLPKEVPVVLAVPDAALVGYLDLMRAVANRLGRTVWAPSGEARLVRNKRGDHTLAMIDRDPEEPVGLWVPFMPSAPSAPSAPSTSTSTALPGEHLDREWTALDGTTFRDSDVATRPLVSTGHERFGRMSLGEDVRDRERVLRTHLHARKLVHLVASGDRTVLVSEEERPQDPAVYSFVAHGLPGGLQLVLRDGRTVWLGAEDGGPYIGGLPEVRELPVGEKGHKIGLEVCWGGSAGNPTRPQLDNRTAPPGQDPLDEVSLGQATANASRRRVKASSMSRGYDVDTHILWDTPGGVAGVEEEFVPEPLDEELDRLARDAGLHTEPGEAPTEVRKVTLRLVRALRQVFGTALDDEGRRAERSQLLAAIGALERYRANDPALSRLTPFRMELWTAFAQRFGNMRPGEAEYRKALDFAVARLRQSPDARLSEDIKDPQIQHAMTQLNRIGERLVRQVLRLPPDIPVGGREQARALWALVAAGRRLAGMNPDFQAKMGRTVLHMPPEEEWAPTKKMDLLGRVAQVVAAGLDPSDYATLAAFDLMAKGAFGPAHLLREGTTVRGYNWSGIPAPDGVDLRVVERQVEGPDGDSSQQSPAGWTAHGEPENIMAVATDTDGHGFVVMHLAGLHPIRVADLEFLALLDLAPLLRATPLGTPLLFLTSGLADTGRKVQVPQLFSNRTSRQSWSYSASLSLAPTSPAPGATSSPLRIVARPQPGTRALWRKTALEAPNPAGSPGHKSAPDAFAGHEASDDMVMEEGISDPRDGDGNTAVPATRPDLGGDAGSGYLRTGPATAQLHGTAFGLRALEAPGSTFGEVLAHALERAGVPLPVAVGELRGWAVARVSETDLPDTLPPLGGDRRVPVGQLDEAGVELSADQRMEAVLLGGDELPVGGVEFTPVQRFRLAAGLGELPDTVDAVVAAVIARELGVALTVIGRDGTQSDHGSPTGPTVLVVHDGDDGDRYLAGWRRR
ncbi:lonely Cys domain-containing protein [Streptomyces cucumeris]|uniref:lonely Cys domain-containing protein n=1 Tax=Streptomyces cucumeris TaxID=2962890 RepID=UPI003D75AC3C